MTTSLPEILRRSTLWCAHYCCGIIRSWAHLQEQAPIRSDAADGREMIVRQRHPQHRRLSAWGPGAHRHRQQIKAGFIYPEDGSLVLLGFFFIVGQHCSAHCLMASSLRWLARSIG